MTMMMIQSSDTGRDPFVRSAPTLRRSDSYLQPVRAYAARRSAAAGAPARKTRQGSIAVGFWRSSSRPALPSVGGEPLPQALTVTLPATCANPSARVRRRAGAGPACRPHPVPTSPARLSDLPTANLCDRLAREAWGPTAAERGRSPSRQRPVGQNSDPCFESGDLQAERGLRTPQRL
jgi:hypothetical protein